MGQSFSHIQDETVKFTLRSRYESSIVLGLLGFLLIWISSKLAFIYKIALLPIIIVLIFTIAVFSMSLRQDGKILNLIMLFLIITWSILTAVAAFLVSSSLKAVFSVICLVLSIPVSITYGIQCSRLASYSAAQADKHESKSRSMN